MKILVFIKKTPDTEAKIKLSADGKNIETGDMKFIINPYDEFAIEEALKMKDKNPATEVVIASFGDEGTREMIVKGLAMGGDRGLLISNEGLNNADSLTIARILAAVVKQEQPNIVFCGKQAIDDDNMHITPMLAELLNWPHVNVVMSLEVSDNKAQAHREVEGGQVEIYEVPLPAVLGAHKSLNTPRFASLPGIMKAKKKPLDVKKPADYGVGSLAGEIKSVIVGYKNPPQKPAGKIFKDEPIDVMVEKVVRLLRDEAKVI